MIAHRIAGWAVGSTPTILRIRLCVIDRTSRRSHAARPSNWRHRYTCEEVLIEEFDQAHAAAAGTSGG
jgi:hypothetical protein